MIPSNNNSRFMTLEEEIIEDGGGGLSVSSFMRVFILSILCTIAVAITVCIKRIMNIENINNGGCCYAIYKYYKKIIINIFNNKITNKEIKHNNKGKLRKDIIKVVNRRRNSSISTTRTTRRRTQSRTSSSVVLGPLYDDNNQNKSKRHLSCYNNDKYINNPIIQCKGRLAIINDLKKEKGEYRRNSDPYVYNKNDNNKIVLNKIYKNEIRRHTTTYNINNNNKYDNNNNNDDDMESSLNNTEYGGGLVKTSLSSSLSLSDNNNNRFTIQKVDDIRISRRHNKRKRSLNDLVIHKLLLKEEQVDRVKDDDDVNIL